MTKQQNTTTAYRTSKHTDKNSNPNRTSREKERNKTLSSTSKQRDRNIVEMLRTDNRTDGSNGITDQQDIYRIPETV